MALTLTCPQGHQWQPGGAESPTAPPVCPVCGLAAADSREVIPPTLVFDQPRPAAESVSAAPAATPEPAAAGPSPSGADTLPRADDAARRGRPVLSQHIPGYTLLGELGRGGMGVVYKARQERLNRIVALKMVLAGARAEPHQLDRFRAEAEAVARLQHPNIVQIYEIGEHDGCPYFSLEFVDGGTLAAKLTGAPQPPRLAAQLVRLLALAVHSAHQKGIIHRDLKPGNILLATPAAPAADPDSFQAETQGALRLYGTPKITDFGLAKHLDSQSQTRTGAVIGTPSYMAPEQAEGRAHAIGPATDVYALGAILYEMLTGRPPFEGDSSLTTIRRMLTQEPVRPSSLHLKVPRDLETICLKCLEKDPGRRYPSAEELAEDLYRFLKGEPIEARPVGWLGRTVKWSKRRPALAALAAVSIAALVTLLTGGVFYHVRLEHAVEEARQSAEENRRNVIRLYVTQGTAAMNGGDGLTALLWFTEALRLDPGSAEHEEPHRRRIAALERGLPRPAQLWVHDGAVTGARFSPDGRHVLTAGDDGRVRLWDAESGEAAAPPMAHAGPVSRAVFSRDGRLVATASHDHTARVWDAATGRPVTPPLRHAGPVRWVDLSPDGRRAVTVGGDGARVWQVGGDPGSPAELKHGGAVNQAVFSPDGRLVATAGEDGLVRLWDAATAKPTQVVLDFDRAVCSVAFSPDGKHVAGGSIDHTARVCDVGTGAPVGRRLRLRGAVTHVAFSPFGRRLLTAGEDGDALIWRVADGERLVDPLRHRSAIRWAVFSPDGCRVATAGDDNVARVWSATTGAPLTPPLRGNGSVNHVAFSPDGRLLVTASDDDTARVWDVACRQQATVVDEAAVFRRRADRLLRVAAADRESGPAAPDRRTSPDGRLVLKINEDNTARIVDARSGAPVTPPLAHANEIVYAAFSPDGRRVVTTSADQTARVWDAATGAPLGPPLAHASTVEFADFGPGGRLATASDDNTARIWDIPAGELLVPPLKHDGTVTRAVFSPDPDGRLVATGGRDRTARVWDASTGQVLTPPLLHPWPVREVAFAADGNRLLTTGPSGTVWSWDLPCARCAAEDMILLARLLCGSRIDEHRGVMPITPAELKEMWRSLRAQRPDLFHFTADDITAWHRQSAEECARGDHGDAALWHLDRLIRREPDEWIHYAHRGLVRAELGRWADAAADFAEVVRRAPDQPEAWCLCGLLRLQAGDAAGYRRACAALADVARKGDDARTGYLTAWLGVLAPDAGPKGAELAAWAKRAADREPNDPDYLGTLGAALYRAGDRDGAGKRLDEALSLRNRQAGAAEWPWLAMVRYRAGRAAEARQCLERAVPGEGGNGHDGADAGASWVQRLQAELLRAEARRLLQSDKSGGK